MREEIKEVLEMGRTSEGKNGGKVRAGGSA